MGTWSAHDRMERMECTPHLLLDQKKARMRDEELSGLEN